MKQFHINRLKKLVEKLKTVPPKSINMSCWWEKAVCLNSASEIIDCGTVGCALGWACQIPSFRKAGLCIYGSQPYYKKTGSFNIDCAADFFGLSKRDAEDIFYRSSYPYFNASKPKIIRQLNNYIRKYQKVLDKVKA